MNDERTWLETFRFTDPQVFSDFTHALFAYGCRYRIGIVEGERKNLYVVQAIVNSETSKELHIDYKHIVELHL